MKRTLTIVVFIFLVRLIHAEPQENAVAPPRTPEQEATLQTTKMQQELGLTSEQVQEVFTINLRHARERQASTSRSDALKRVKYKEQELQRVLSPAQYDRLQEMRYDHPATSTIDAPVKGRTRPVTNPQRLESGRIIRSRESSQPGTSTRRTGTVSPVSGQAYPRGREVSPATRSSENRRASGSSNSSGSTRR